MATSAVFINAAQSNNYTGTVLASIATPALGLTAGNFVVVLVRGGTAGVTDSLGNTYTQRASDGGTLRIFSCAGCLGGSAVVTATFTPSASYVSIVALQFSGVGTGEFISAFTTTVSIGNILDLSYHSGGSFGSIVVGLADIFAAGSFGFAALGTTADPAAYIEPVTDHTSASFFYRLPSLPLTADTVRATCTVGTAYQKNLLVAVFKSLTSETSLKTVPDVLNQTEASAEAELIAAGVVKGTVSSQWHQTTPSGLVISQGYPAGNQVPPSTPVSLVLSSGSSGFGLLTSVVKLGDGSASITTTPIDTTEASLIVLWLGSWVNWGTVSDNKENVWTNLSQQNNGNNGGRFIYCAGPVRGPGHTFTVSGVSYPSLIVYVFGGQSSGFQVEITGKGQNTQTVSTGSVTPATDNALVLTGFTSGYVGPPLTVAPAEFAPNLTQNVGTGNAQTAALAFWSQSTAAPVNPAWSWTSGNIFNVLATTIVFKSGAPTAAGRVSQVALEVLGQSSDPVSVRLAQLPLEILGQGVLPDLRVSQVATEVMVQAPLPEIRLSQVAVEVMFEPASSLPAKLSQVAVEVMYVPGEGGLAKLVRIWMSDGGGRIWMD